VMVVAAVAVIFMLAAVFVVSVVMSHIFSFRCHFDISKYEIYLNYIGIECKSAGRESL
jgi:hypothetical protein